MRTLVKVRIVITAAAALVMISANYSYAQRANRTMMNRTVEEIRERKLQNKQKRQDDIKRLQKKIEPLANGYTIEELQLALTIKAVRTYEGAAVFSDQKPPVYLGLVADEFVPESIFNIFEKYGSEFNPMGIWNTFGTYGSSFSYYSPFNMFAPNPPVIVKDGKIIGRLTINNQIADSVDPNWLKLFFRY